ncbi:hypothetical protein Tco_1288101 [Tanacetum coccineum]
MFFLIGICTYSHRILEANPLLILKTFECLWLHTLYAKPKENEFKSFSGQCLSEYICQLILCPHEIQLNHSLFHLFSDEMMSDVNVFRPRVLDVVAAESYDTLVAIIQRDVICLDNMHDLRLPQLNSGMSAFNLNEPIYSTSFIIHSESASGNDGSTASTTKADLGNSAPSTDPYVLADQTKSVSEGLEILVSHVQPSFKDLNSPEDDPVIIVDDIDEDEDDEVHATENSQKHKLELEKNKAEVALLKAQPSFPNVEQHKELLVKSLKTEFSNILSAHDFSSSLPTELKDLPSKLNELTEEVKGLKKQVHELEIELPGDLKEIPTKLDDFTKNVTSLTSQVADLKTLQWELPAKFLSLPVQVASVQAKLKTLDALPCLFLNVTQALNKFAQVLNFASSKAGDQNVLSAGQADTLPAKREKNINQATTS